MDTENTIDLSENTIDSKLYIDFGNSPDKAALPLGIGRPKKMDPYSLRYPWDDISHEYYKGCNLSINLNPDPQKIEDYNNKKIVMPLLYEYLTNSIQVQRAIVVYEWGVRGKEYGKLHFHMLIKTINRDSIISDLANIFNSQTKVLHRTITSKFIKSVDHRDTYIKYMKKETQNKIKCGYIKNL